MRIGPLHSGADGHLDLEHPPQQLRDRQHHLAVRHAGQQLLVQPHAPLGQPAGVARRAEVPALAAKRHQKLGAARLTSHPRKTVLEQAAV